MSKTRNKLNIIMITVLSFLLYPFKAFADSGLEASYGSGSDSSAIGSLSSVASPVFKLIAAQPGDEDYAIYHIIIAVICIIVFLVFTTIFSLKINDKRKKNIAIFGISLIPTLFFSLICLLTKLPLFIYALLLIPYIIIFKIVSDKKFKKRLKEKINEIYRIDKDFNIDFTNSRTFDIYRNLQLAWSSFDLNMVKDSISEDIYNKYQKKLDELKKDKQRNVMDEIELVSNELTNIDLVNDTEVIECKMVVTCIDYIIDENNKIVKGKKDKKRTYTYKLVFNRDIETDKYILIEKKLKKEK